MEKKVVEVWFHCYNIYMKTQHPCLYIKCNNYNTEIRLLLLRLCHHIKNKYIWEERNEIMSCLLGQAKARTLTAEPDPT